MKVSIVIPTYNCATLLETTLRSIQTGGHDELEVIVMDGGSSDHIAEVVKSFGDLVSVFVSEPDNGQYDAINKGMNRSTAEVMAWINGGDFFLPGAIANAVEIFKNYNTVEWITGRQCVAEGPSLRRMGKYEVVVSNMEIRCGMCCGGATGFLQQEGMFWRRSLWEKAGCLDLNYKLAGDFELWTRFSRETDLVRFTEPLAAFSYHDTNRSIVEKDAYLAEVARAIENLPEKERRQRRWLELFPWAMRVIRKIPLIKEMVRWVLQRSSRFSTQVISWKKTKSGGFRMESHRRIAWIR